VPFVREQFYMISSDRKIMHPAVEAILAGSQKAIPPAA
jgi:LysR family transcriptional activator of nhaA